jgi:BirA family biotin operon repressor/biotin-[acetyl-CoA-carboxylase] ligase
MLQAVLKSKPGRISFAELEKETGCDRKTLKEAAQELCDSGVGQIGRGYFDISELPDLILPAIILYGLKSRVMGRRIFAYKSIGSTNNTAKRLAESDSPEGAIVIAEKQTRGRGRLGRSWLSPINKGLYFSIILRPRVQIERMPALSLVAALSICKVIESKTSLEPKIKWPNDCLIGGKKTAGILVDISAEPGRVSYAILGVGINVNTAIRDFSKKISRRATSLSIEAGSHFNRAEILRRFLEEFEGSYRNFQTYGLRFIAPELVKRSSVIGRKIEFSLGPKNYAGIALGYDEKGGLRVKLKDGVKILSGGEVRLKK